MASQRDDDRAIEEVLKEDLEDASEAAEVLEARQKLESLFGHLRGSEQATNELPQVIPDRIGRFEIRDWLGSGTFGEIFLGLDSDLKRKVAIRVPRSDYLAVTRSGQFLREARTAAQLDHPGIVGVLEVRDGEDGTYIVSDFIDGLPLDRCTNGRAMAANEAFQILLTVSLAIEHVHQAG